MIKKTHLFPPTQKKKKKIQLKNFSRKKIKNKPYSLKHSIAQIFLQNPFPHKKNRQTEKKFMKTSQCERNSRKEDQDGGSADCREIQISEIEVQ
jgi:hypothetical protein